VVRSVKTDLAQLQGLGKKKKSGRGRGIFLDFPLYSVDPRRGGCLSQKLLQRNR
jgi:hypothetical protein